jgi:hypothetical protein
MLMKKLNDQQLVESTRMAIQASREALVQVLRHFKEIESRRLWIHAGSLYKYLSRTFELTDDQVYPRLQAMRLMNAIPEVEQKLEDGQLSVTNALKAHQALSARYLKA